MMGKVSVSRNSRHFRAGIVGINGTGLPGGNATIGSTGGNGGNGGTGDCFVQAAAQVPVNPILGGGPFLDAVTNPGAPGEPCLPGTVTTTTPNGTTSTGPTNTGTTNTGGGQVPAPGPLGLIAAIGLLGAWRQRRKAFAA